MPDYLAADARGLAPGQTATSERGHHGATSELALLAQQLFHGEIEIRERGRGEPLTPPVDLYRTVPAIHRLTHHSNMIPIEINQPELGEARSGVDPCFNRAIEGGR